MFKPTLEEFKKLSQSGNLIPVYKEILADLDTPVSAYMKIRGGEYSFLLESVEGGEKWARYCFLGCDPAVVVTSKGRKITIDENGKRREVKVESGTPLTAIKEVLARYNPVTVPGLPRFSGGAVGFISYDMVRFFEDLPEDTVDDLNVPDSQFIITDTMLVFDNVSQTIKIVSNAFIDEENLETVYEQTIKKIELLETKLKTPLKVSTQQSQEEVALKFDSNFEKEKFKDAVDTIFGKATQSRWCFRSV
jgi:anthranilate synthase component 1